jgi:chromosome segregation ATPase
MRNILLVSWLVLPIGAWAYHEGPGQDRAALEETDAVIVAANDAAQSGRWKEAVRRYEEALGKLPKQDTAASTATVQRLQIELNKARMQASGLPDARADLDALVEHMEGDATSDPKLLAEARQALARAQFFTTWLMRLEGLDREAWEPEIEAARQNWRLLAEQAGNEAEAAMHRRDLEAAIRLARLDIEDLQGLPLPSE